MLSLKRQASILDNRWLFGYFFNQGIILMNANEKIRSEGRARILKALAHPTRIFIVDKLAEKPYCVCELTGMVGPTPPPSPNTCPS